MSAMRLDTDLCRACGQCARVCPAGVLARDEATRRPVADAAFDDLCLRCAQCMAVCEPKAIAVGDLAYDVDTFEFGAPAADAAAFRALLESRRSIRRFSSRPVEAATLDQLAAIVATAPMGFPPHKAALTIVAGRERIEPAAPLIKAFYDGLLQMLGRPLSRWLFRRSMSRGDWSLLADHLEPLLRHARRLGADDDLATLGAPVVVLVHAHRDAPDFRSDAGIVLTYVFLAAHALGLGATVIGLLPPAVQRLPELRALWGIADDQCVTGAVILGHPAVRFQRGVRRPMEVHWRNGAEAAEAHSAAA